jgi:hypothetical protein
MRMNKRPTSVTIIAWLFIVVGGVFLIDSWNDLKVKGTLLQFILTFFQMLFPFISGIGLLKRQNWARFLYLICWILLFVIHILRNIYILRNPMTTGLIGGSVLFLITIFFLFRPKANDYFAGRDSINAPTET